ncbi:hypothetical protein E4633_03740 [Geomonas terrae]|uniref:NACHT domain-containing protein n=1 Tax=Geomonas terrae TaxID=2562681 RepID=A0A4S1CLF4_9BACT|nr:hypothetical protein [Geomonas terrae]TGU74587.1 hypothetical protein E4633_03740 [Geomonas terrae]
MQELAMLKALLQNEAEPGTLERLAAALLGQLLGLTIAVAKSGFQHGGDAGPSGRQGRHFRIECKRYGDKTPLSDRELLGEIDHALSRDPALEAWILVATREVPEQLEQSLNLKGESIGVPVVILDWKKDGVPALAALCAHAPDIVEHIFSAKAGELARRIGPISAETTERLQRDLQSWCLGFESLKSLCWKKILSIWESPRASNAALGQNAAGGAESKKIRRRQVHDALDVWWHGAAHDDAPAAVIGWDGVGKTWATLDWLVDSHEVLPAVMVIPSSAAAVLRSGAETELKCFLANCLYEITGLRDSQHWLRRLNNLLRRPADEGPVLTLLLDGLNQEPSVPWVQLLKTLQGEAFQGRVRVLISTRPHHFGDRLHGLRGLVVTAVQVAVGPFDRQPGGELDRLLAFEGLTQADLHPGVLRLAQNPRLFRLVMHLKDRLVEAGQVTIHRLLWEYGRDTLGYRDGKSFSEAEWLEWLQEIAGLYRDGIQSFSLKELSDTAARADLSGKEIYARLSDIIDGRFAIRDTSGNIRLTPDIVAHALGVALVAELEGIASPSFDSVNNELTRWLDPLGGLEQRADVLRAAVSIIVERGVATSPVAGVLVTAWLQTQNVPDEHRLEVVALATELCEPLLCCIEHSTEYANASARGWSVNALRAIPRTDFTALAAIVGRACQWLSVVSREVEPNESNSEIEKRRSEHFAARIGVDASGPIRVLGLDLRFVDHDSRALGATLPSILEGFPLAPAVSIFETAAVVMAIKWQSGSMWDRLKWLCLLNEVDPLETTDALRAVSGAVLKRHPEPGVHQGLPARAAALLLWMTGEEVDESEAAAIDSGLDRHLFYQKDYLPDPCRSWFRLERRHVEAVLHNIEVPIRVRIQRTREFWLDPHFEPPAAFINEVREYALQFAVECVGTRTTKTAEDLEFEDLEPVLARCDPNLLTDLIRRKMQSLRACPPESRYWAAIHAPESLLIAGDAESEAARILRSSATLESERNELTAVTNLLIIELHNKSFTRQIEVIIEADLEHLYTDLLEIFQKSHADETDALICRFSNGSEAERRALLTLLSHTRITNSDTAWAWLTQIAFGSDVSLQGLAYFALRNMDSARFGNELFLRDWTWSPSTEFWINHYGSGALIAGTIAVPFDQVAPRLAPWRLLEAACRRGSHIAELRLAATILGEILRTEHAEVPDPGVTVVADRPEGEDGQLSLSVMAKESTADSITALLQAFEHEAQMNALQRAAKTAIERIRSARANGAKLYLTNVHVEDLEAVVVHIPEFLEGWLEGSETFTTDFRRRVLLAESVYLSLCEALLKHDTVRGVTLWRSLRQALRTRYVGRADIDDLVHMAFRAPDKPEISELRKEIIKECSTDKELLEIAIAATCNGKGEWLSNLIAEDKSSRLPWRRKRGVVLEGFTAHNDLPIPDAWPDYELKTGHEGLYHDSCCQRSREGSSHHWWKKYLSSSTATDGYAAWVLFLRSADRRAWIWLGADVAAADDGSDLFQLKMKHATLNKRKVERWMKKHEDGFDKKFLKRDITDNLGPWVR